MPEWHQLVCMSRHVKESETAKILQLYATSIFQVHFFCLSTRLSVYNFKLAVTSKCSLLYTQNFTRRVINQIQQSIIIMCMCTKEMYWHVLRAILKMCHSEACLDWHSANFVISKLHVKCKVLKHKLCKETKSKAKLLHLFFSNECRATTNAMSYKDIVICPRYDKSLAHFSEQRTTRFRMACFRTACNRRTHDYRKIGLTTWPTWDHTQS